MFFKKKTASKYFAYICGVFRRRKKWKKQYKQGMAKHCPQFYQKFYNYCPQFYHFRIYPLYAAGMTLAK